MAALKRQRMAVVALFKSPADKTHSYNGVVEVLETIPKGSTLDLSMYTETSAKGNVYFKGTAYIKPVAPAVVDTDLQLQ